MNFAAPTPFSWAMIGGRPRGVLKKPSPREPSPAPMPLPPLTIPPDVEAADVRRAATALDVRACLDEALGRTPFDPRFGEAVEEVACAAVGEPVEHMRVIVASLAEVLLSGGPRVPEGAIRSLRAVAKAMAVAPGYRASLTVETFRSAAAVILRAYRDRPVPDAGNGKTAPKLPLSPMFPPHRA